MCMFKRINIENSIHTLDFPYLSFETCYVHGANITQNAIAFVAGKEFKTKIVEFNKQIIP